MVLVAYEMQTSLGDNQLALRNRRPDMAFRIERFVDDVRVFVVFPLCKAELWAMLLAQYLLNLTYPEHFKLKDDVVNPTVGMQVYVRDGQLQ